MIPVGYLRKFPDRLEGQRGECFDYVLASNGLFIEAEGKLLAARVPVARCEVRGLAPLEPKVVLRHGKIPQHLFDLAHNTMLTTPDKERFVAITHTDSYHIEVPKQADDKEKVGQGIDEGHGTGAGVAYLNPDSVVLEMHTHPKLAARFSGTDNRDETGFRLYGVIGHCGHYHEVTDDMSHDEAMGWMQNNCPAIRIRAGVYGYFYEIAWSDIFDGHLTSELLDIGSEDEDEPLDLLEEAYRDPWVSDEVKEDIERELHR
jgi:hypothetical protein